MKNTSLYKKRHWIFFILLGVLLVVVRLPSFAEPLENDSGSVAFLARQMMQAQNLYDRFHTGHHLPGIYYTFEWAFKLFGDNPNAPKLLLLPVMLISALLLYFLGLMYFDERTGMLSAVLFILISSQRGLAGMTVEMEQFANLPLIAGIFLLIVLLDQKASAWQFFWLGILGAVSFLYKAIFVTPLVVAVCSIVLMAWITRNETGAWKTMLFRLFWLTIGFIIPVGIVAGYFARLGLWERFLLIFEYGTSYFDGGSIDLPGLPPPFGYPLLWMSLNNIALLFLGLLGIYHLAKYALPVKSSKDLTGIILILWFVISFALAGLRGGGYAHYCLLAVPPLVFVATIEVVKLRQYWSLRSERVANLLKAATVALVVLFFLWSNASLSNASLYREYTLYKLNVISQEQFLRKVYKDGFVSQQISSYIKSHTEPNDFIYLWSFYIDVYYYADRQPPIDMLWPSYAGATGSPTRIFNERTKYIIVDIPKNGPLPQWLVDGLAANYVLENVIENTEIYRRNSP